MKSILICFVVLIFFLKAHAHEESVGAVIGPNKAVKDTRFERQEFKLSAATLNIFGVELITLKTDRPGTFVVPSSAIVSYQENFGIYIEKVNWAKCKMWYRRSRRSSPVSCP